MYLSQPQHISDLRNPLLRIPVPTLCLTARIALHPSISQHSICRSGLPLPPSFSKHVPQLPSFKRHDVFANSTMLRPAILDIEPQCILQTNCFVAFMFISVSLWTMLNLTQNVQSLEQEGKSSLLGDEAAGPVLELHWVLTTLKSSKMVYFPSFMCSCYMCVTCHEALGRMESFDDKSKLFWSVTTSRIYVKSLVCTLSTLLGIQARSAQNHSLLSCFCGWGWHTVDIAQRCGHGVQIPTFESV